MEVSEICSIPVAGKADPSSWLKALPYDASDHAPLLDEIISITRNILSVEEPCNSLLVLLDRNLESYIQLKYPIPMESRVFLVKAIYFLVTRKDYDEALIGQLAQLCRKLVKDERLCPDSALTLQWRPLYEHISPHTLGKERDMIPKRRSLRNIFDLVHAVKRFFPPEATIEILEELLPKINVHNIVLSLNTSIFLRQFLPTKNIPEMPRDMPEATPAFYWVPTIFTVLSLFTNSLALSQAFMGLFASLAKYRTHDPGSIGFTKENIAHIFTAALRCMQLPVGSDTPGKSSNSTEGKITIGSLVFPLMQNPKLSEDDIAMNLFDKKKIISPFAKFVVYSLYEKPTSTDGTPSVPYIHQYEIMNMLEMLVMSISSHLHPLNHSGWSITISKLISLLSINFLIRLRKEEAPRCKTPNIYKITPSLRRRFVEALLPLLQISTLSKNRTVVINSAQAIKHLIWIDPEAATPKILSKVVYALGQSQDKPYLVYNCNKVLAQMIYPTLNIKDTSLWVEAVSRCLELSVSAVDVNDDTGAISALSFISAFSMCVPIIDISDATADSPDTYSRLAGELTTIFDTWVLEFLEKIFALMQNLPLLHAVNHGKSSESILLNTALYAYGDVMQQSSPKIEKLVVDRLLRFTKTCIPNATNAIGILCSLIANSDLRLSVFAERSANIMLEELEKGAARNVTNNALSDSNLPFGFASMSDSKFHWHQSILMHILLHSGISILKYKDLVKKVLLESIKKVKSRTGFQWAAKTLSNVIYSLTSVYPLDSRCLTDEAWEKNKTSESPNRHWGSSYTSENACIRWHVCIAEELDYSLELMEIFFDLSIQNLDAWLENFSLEVEYTIEAEKWLEILKRCVLCTYTFMEPKCTRPPGFGRMEGFNIHNNSQLLGVRFINTGSSLDENDPRYPKLQNYLEKACRVLVEVSKRLYSENIENVYLLISAVNSMSVYICDETYCIDRYAGLLHTYRTKKMELIEARNNGKLLRSLIVRRAYALHHLRVMCNFYRKPFGLLEKNICEQIIKWTRCKYSEVRKSAQYSIKASVRIFSFELGGILRTDILNFIDSCCTRMDGLLRKTESSPRKTQENEYNVEAELLISEIKGVLFTLKGDIVLNFNLETWDKKFQLFTSLLCLYKHELRHNVRILCHDVLTELLEKVSWTSPCERWVYYTTFNGISLKNADIYKDVMSSTFMSDHPPNSTGLEKFIEYNNEYGHPSKDKYLSVIDTALEYARTKDTKWITVILVIKFLFLFLRTTEDVPEELVSFALSAIVSDIRTNRLLGLQLLTRIIVIFKFKRRQKLPPWKIKAPPSPDIIKQCLDDRPLSKDMFENTMFNDKSSLGWLCWPSKCTFRYGGRCSYNIECGLEDDKAFKSLKLGLSSEDFWRKFINFFSEESEHADSRVSDKMLPLFFRFFFGLFVTEHLSIINPIIDELVVNSNDPDKQKFLAQFVGGMIRGSKHWGWSHIERLWDWATDIIKKGLFSSGRQIFGYWTEYSIFFTLRGRDPLRMFTLIKIILDEKIDMNPKMVLPEVQRLTLIMLILLLPLSWRLVNSRKRLLQQCASQLDPAYDIMSEYIGSNISSLLRAQFYPGHKDTISLLKWCVTLRKSIEDKPTTESRDIITHTSQPYQVSPTVEQSGSLAEDTESSINFFRGGSPTPDIINKIITCFRESLHGVSETDPHHPNNAAYLRICKIICALTTNEVTYYSGMGMHLFIRDITPPLLSMLAYHDIGLHAMATRVVNSYPYLFYTPYTLNEFVKIVSDFFEGDMTYTAALTNRRKAHIRILTILQAFTFNQMFVLMGEHIEKITEIVIGSLYYPHVEVRSLSAVTLSCIIVCFYQNNVDRFICRFKERLEYYGKPSSLDSKSRINMTREQVKERSSDVNLVGKHGSILGLCAVMNAFPYTVKPWMADLLTTLAGYSNECHPISGCIGKLFRDFRHAHQATWGEDLKSFDEDDRRKISDVLCSQSYYA